MWRDSSRLAIGLAVASLAGCMIPQDTTPAPNIEPDNRPPAVELRSVWPQAPVVEINLNPVCDVVLPTPGQFILPIIELDTDQTLVARWFLDYELDGTDVTQAPILPQTLPPVPDAEDPRLRFSILDPSRLVRLAPELGPHTLEAFVVESEALTGDSEEVPRWRALRDCTAEADPDCLSTHPAVFRWTLDVRFDETCP